MTMQLRLVTWNLPFDWLPDAGDPQKAAVIDLVSILDRDLVVDMIANGGWAPISHTISSNTDGSQVLSVLFQEIE